MNIKATKRRVSVRKWGSFPWLVVACAVFCATMCQASVVVICHPGLSGFDAKDLNRIYTGRVVRVGGEAVRPVNLKSGSSVRDVFMRDVLKQSDDDYISYWIVRRAIGKGAPPPEIDNPNELLDFIRHNAGAIGYLDNTGLDLTGVTVVLTVGK